MEDMSKKLENLKNQQEQAKELFIKCQGAIEFIQGMIDEEKDTKEKKDKKQFFEIEVKMANKDKGVVKRAIVTPDKPFLFMMIKQLMLYVKEQKLLNLILILIQVIQVNGNILVHIIGEEEVANRWKI